MKNGLLVSRVVLQYVRWMLSGYVLRLSLIRRRNHQVDAIAESKRSFEGGRMKYHLVVSLEAANVTVDFCLYLSSNFSAHNCCRSSDFEVRAMNTARPVHLVLCKVARCIWVTTFGVFSSGGF